MIEILAITAGALIFGIGWSLFVIMIIIMIKEGNQE